MIEKIFYRSELRALADACSAEYAVLFMPESFCNFIELKTGYKCSFVFTNDLVKQRFQITFPDETSMVEFKLKWL